MPESSSTLPPLTLITNAVRPIVSALHPDGENTFSVRSRSTGHTYKVPMRVLTLDGYRYIVSVRGGTEEWVADLRAAGQCELKRRRVHKTYRAEELPDDAKPRLIRAYRLRWGKQVEAFFRQLPDPADHPAFKLTSTAPPTTVGDLPRKRS